MNNELETYTSKQEKLEIINFHNLELLKNPDKYKLKAIASSICAISSSEGNAILFRNIHTLKLKF